jgi:hypothetical protein
MTIICKKCNTIEASYNFANEKLPSFCNDCKEVDMKYIRKRQLICKYPECSKQRSFGFIGGKTTFCITHKEEGMVNLKHSRCKEQGCKLTPCYENNSHSKFCFIHCIRGMKCFNTKLAQEQMGKYF